MYAKFELLGFFFLFCFFIAIKKLKIVFQFRVNFVREELHWQFLREICPISRQKHV